MTGNRRLSLDGNLIGWYLVMKSSCQKNQKPVKKTWTLHCDGKRNIRKKYFTQELVQHLAKKL